LEIRRAKSELELEQVRQNADEIRERCKSFKQFVIEAWKVLEPSTPLKWAWHMDAIAMHLEAITFGQITPKLIVNIPPGSSKSMLISVLWQAWVWGPCNMPGKKFLSTSYDVGNVNRDTRKTRDLILSEWYQELWPMPLKRQGEASFENYSFGTREGVAFVAMMGKRGDFVMIDDPHSLTGSESEVERTKAVRIFIEGGQNRLNDQQESAMVIVMQRLHEADLTGALLARELGYIHVMIPMEFEVENKSITPIWEDPRSYDGELMDPVRMPQSAVELLKKDNDYMWAGQYQQRPAPREGGMIKVDRILYVDSVPGNAVHVRGWDIAGSTRKTSPYTVGARLAVHEGIVFIVDIRRERAEIDIAERLIVTTAHSDGIRIRQSIPQDPGQAGKPVWAEHNVLMGNGLRKPLREIVIGESVIGIDGRPHAVSAVYEQGDLPTLEIITASGRSLFAAIDHPFLTTEGWLEAQELREGHFLGLRSLANTDPVSARTLEEFRLAGYFIGDGSVGIASANGPGGSCDAGFSCADPDTLADFTRCVESLGGAVVRRFRDCTFGARGMQDWLRKTDIAGYTSYTKRVPAWVFGGSNEQIAHFVGAYMATDGTVSEKEKEAIFYSVSRDLLSDVQQLLLRLGIHATIKVKNGKYLETRHVSHLLRLAQREDAVRRFARMVPVHNTLKAGRLAAWAQSSTISRFPSDFIADRIVEIRDGGMRPCRCLTVEGAESFLIEDAVVHNSQRRHLAGRLAGLDFVFSTETGAKEDRAIPFASMVNAGQVRMVNAPWNEALINEMRNFPGSLYKDQVDAISRGFHELIPYMQEDDGIGVGAPIYPGRDD
jgi:phage terminase large subunit-like protein